MNVLQIIAHPDLAGNSFTGQLARKFREGALEAGHTVEWYNLFERGAADFDHKQFVLEADHICFAYPVWWEMPPSKLVDYLQTVFVKGFAFDLDGDRMRPKFQKDTTCLLSMGQLKDHNTKNLHEAMVYCGLHPLFYIFNNVGPRLSPELSEEYLNLAYRAGQEI